MAQAGYTPISLYYSTTTTVAPSAGDLVDGELAINITDGKLFYKDNLNNVQIIATKTSGGFTWPGAGIPNSTGSAWGTSYSTSGSGTVVALTTSPAFTTPDLGTPSAATLTYAVGLPISTGVSGLGTSVATALAVNVGTAGAFVVNGGALGTPLSGTLTNATGLPLTTGVTGTLPVANGGTGLTSGTSGGVLYYSASGTLASSGTLAASAIMLGGGAGVAPSTTTTGTGVVTALGNNANATGGFATINGTATLTNKRIDPRVSSTASAASVTPDISSYDQYVFTAQAATLAINAPIGTPVDGNKLIFRILDNGSSQTLNWNGTYTAIGVTLPTSTTISKTTYVGCIYNLNNTRWDVVAVTTQA